MRVIVTPDPFDANAELAAFAEARAGAGALASFIGFCRAEDGAVTQLDLQHYPGFTETEIARLADAIRIRHAVDDLLVIHRVGAISPGQAIVLVAALSRHRTAAFAAVEELMDYLKTDAPLWKRESGPSGARWIEPTDLDRERRAALTDENK
ncbi:MAG TPA: molybdenum cofactor biosynthesis protein MoaE [Caulobacterales bacterium]|nr:molybdenum cofactor biosynthesis protein MoaE [Caulobacterales bacterium]